MSILYTLFSSKVTWVVLAIVGLMALFGVQQARIAHLKSVVANRDATIDAARGEIAATKTLVTQWQQSYATLTRAVETQNAAIVKLEAEVAARMAKAKEAVRLAEIERSKANELADQLQLMEVAKDECMAMRQLIDAYVVGVR